MFNRFSLCFFDVLGFESRFSALGLGGMLEKYLALIRLVDAQNEQMHRVFGEMEFSESAYWTSDGEAFVFSRLFGAYASDSILIWTHTDFPAARYPAALNMAPDERDRRASDPRNGWQYHPIPCDNLLNVCNEIICHSLEIGLPLRGALALGESVLHIDRNVFLGQPLIDAARLEHSQKLIGASFSPSFMGQVVPQRYLIPFDKHIKDGCGHLFQGNVLDWPRHWRNTRKTDPRKVINSLNTVKSAGDYYENTLSMIDASEDRANMYNGQEDTWVRNVYPQFSPAEVSLRARAMRRVRIDENRSDEQPGGESPASTS